MKVQQAVLAGLGMVLLLVVFWFVLYAPAGERLAEAQDAATRAEQEQDVARSRIRALEGARSNAPDAEALLATARSVIPDDMGMPSALRQVQDAADGAGVEVLGVLPSAAVPTDVDPGLVQVSIGLQLRGSYFQLVDFLRRLEDPRLTARGLVGEFVVLRLEDYPSLSADLSLTMFARQGISVGADPGAPDEQAPAGAEGDFAEDDLEVEAAGAGR